MTEKIIYLFLSLIMIVVLASGELHQDSFDDLSDIRVASDAKQSSYSTEKNEYAPYRYTHEVTEIVKVDFYYETLCSYCKNVYNELPSLVMDLGTYINLRTYPYGLAKMSKEQDEVTVTCRHGKEECYGNKLHACAINFFGGDDVTNYINYNACLMNSGSDDNAADTCGGLMRIDSKSIKNCAISELGTEMLIYYGQASEEIGYDYVPYVLINGKEKPFSTSLKKAVCHAFNNPPKVCLFFTRKNYNDRKSKFV